MNSMPMDTSPEAQSALIRILSHEVEQTQRLLELLLREYQLLQSSPGKALEELLDEKRLQLEAMETSVGEQQRFLRQQDLPCDRKGTLDYLEACGNPHLTEIWQGLESLLRKCQKQNRINGGAVTLNQRQTKQMLEILLGLGEGNKTYGPSGESRPVNSPNSLGKA